MASSYAPTLVFMIPIAGLYSLTIRWYDRPHNAGCHVGSCAQAQ